MISESRQNTHIVLILEHIFAVNTLLCTGDTHTDIMDYGKLNSIFAGLYKSSLLT